MACMRRLVGEGVHHSHGRGVAGEGTVGEGVDDGEVHGSWYAAARSAPDERCRPTGADRRRPGRPRRPGADRGRPGPKSDGALDCADDDHQDPRPRRGGMVHHRRRRPRPARQQVPELRDLRLSPLRPRSAATPGAKAPSSTRCPSAGGARCGPTPTPATRRRRPTWRRTPTCRSASPRWSWPRRRWSSWARSRRRSRWTTWPWATRSSSWWTCSTRTTTTSTWCGSGGR